jgi:tRNA(adenine34) deaminase
MDHQRWMARLIEHAKAAARDGEAPVAAMIVRDDQILAVGRNTKTSEQCGFAHAELNALLSARCKLGRAPENAVLYSTLEPCAMCLGAITFAGIRKVVYGAPDPQGGAVSMFRTDPIYRDWMPEAVAGVLARECEALKGLPGFGRREGR